MRISCHINNSIADVVAAYRSGQRDAPALRSYTYAVLADVLVSAVLPSQRPRNRIVSSCLRASGRARWALAAGSATHQHARTGGQQ